MIPQKGQIKVYLSLSEEIINIILAFFFLNKMNLKALLIFGLFAMLATASETPPCTLYLYPSKPDPENLYDATKSFILPFGRIEDSHGVRLPLREAAKYLYAPQYYEKPINSVKYIVTQGDRCDLCGVVGVFDYGYDVMFMMSSTPGEIYTLDKCRSYIEMTCDYYYYDYVN